MVAEAIAEKIGEDLEKLKKRRVDWASEVIKRGVIVELHVGRTRFLKKMTKEDLGLDIPDAEFQKFMSDYIDLGSKLLIPKKALLVFDRVEGRGRGNLYRHSFSTPWGLFVPCSAYAKWKEANEKLRTEYIEETEKLKEAIPSLKIEILSEYRAAASKLYERTSKDKSLEQFTEEFLKNLEVQIPDSEEIERTFYYDEDIFYIPLPSEVEEELLKAEVFSRERLIERARTDAEIDKMRSETQMHKDAVAKIIESKQKKIDSLIDSVSGELRGAIYSTLKDALHGIKKKASISASSIKSMKGLIEKTRMMNFMNDTEIEDALLKIENALEEQSAGNSVSDVTQTLHGIAKEFRLASLDIEDELPDIREFGFLL